jgi:phage/conjugal plasmid C-4 type zinc finger TraR family protein
VADEADRAGDVIDAAMATALAGIKSTMGIPSNESCAECGDEIPEQRRKLGGVTRCVSCQTYFEVRNRR